MRTELVVPEFLQSVCEKYEPLFEMPERLPPKSLEDEETPHYSYRRH